MKKTVVVFGGSQENTLRKLGLKRGIDVLFHSGKTRNGGNKREFKNLVKRADCVVLQVGAIGHVSMDIVKDLCKKQGKELLFHTGFGASGAISMCVEHLERTAA